MTSDEKDDEIPFLVGTAISTYQNSGGPGTNWSDFEEQTYKGASRIFEGQKCGVSCDFWNRYEEDIGLAKELGSTALRFSLEWSRIQPSQGVVDETAVQRYNDIFDCLERNGMEPLVTLHHFVHPMWFEELGGFLEEKNVEVFRDYAVLAFKLFGSRVRLWATFNEPNIASLCGFVYGVHPPARWLDLKAAGTNIGNMLRSHTAAYKAIKALPGGRAAEIGLVHNWMDYDPQEGMGIAKTWIAPFCRVLAGYWANEAVVEYFRTGHYYYSYPLGVVEFQEPGPIPGIDFVGLNYYTRSVIDWKGSGTSNPGDVMTDMGNIIYPEGLYRGIAGLSVLGVPVYITETGIADASDTKREAFIKAYLGQVARALEDGYDVGGVMYWTLMDNFEWQDGYSKKFGLYQWSPDGSQERKLKKGSEVIKEIYRELPKLAAQKRLERRPASQIPQRQIATSATSQNGAGMGSRRCLRSFF